jgi:membrane-associated phospholipid phosphatase
MMIKESLKSKFPAYALWIGGANIFFFIVYGFCNHYASTLPPEKLLRLYFDWELQLPLVPWLILPYRSIEILFTVTIFFLSRKGLERYGKQMMIAMIIAGFIFVLFPGECGFQRPNPDELGAFGIFFKILYSLDKPHNLFPSLHITYCYLGLRAFIDHTNKYWLKSLFAIWFVLICFSVILTYQHHLFDLVSGLLLGFLIYKYTFTSLSNESLNK